MTELNVSFHWDRSFWRWSFKEISWSLTNFDGFRLGDEMEWVEKLFRKFDWLDGVSYSWTFWELLCIAQEFPDFFSSLRQFALCLWIHQKVQRLRFCRFFRSMSPGAFPSELHNLKCLNCTWHFRPFSWHLPLGKLWTLANFPVCINFSHETYVATVAN